MKALSIRQPWAWLIMVGRKDIECRAWKPPKSIIGEEFLVHTGKKIMRPAIYPVKTVRVMNRNSDYWQYPLALSAIPPMRSHTSHK